MRYLRIGFAVAVLALATVALLWLSRPRVSPDRPLPGFSPFQLTRIAPPGGKVYLDRDMTRPADVSRLDWSGRFELNADTQSAFEFICFATVFTAHPGSSITYDGGQRRLVLESGEFSWHLVDPRSRIEVLLGGASGSLLLPRRGQLRVTGNETELWTYEGAASLRLEGETHPVPVRTRFFRFRGRRPREDTLLPPPGKAAPENVVIPLRKPDDSVVRFSWQRVPGAATYVFRLYPTRLRERILMERTIPGNQLNVELMVFRDHSDFFWDVAAVARDSGLEGVPTVPGNIRLEGSLLGEKSVTRPPQLVITSLTVGGNIVLIKGEAEGNSRLYINSEPVKIDMDGKFIHTMTFRTIGVKTIEFRLVSPSETETVITRQVTIFEEGI